MSSEEIIVKAEGLSKRYEIYSRPQDRLKQMIMSRLASMTGKQSPAYYKEFWALKNISLQIARGETVGIIGRNGSGKSTLLQMICGTLNPTSGSSVTHGRTAALLELGAGFNPEFTGRENVFLSGMLYGLTEAELREKYDAIVEFAEIGDFISEPVKTYSSGMYVRLAFAVAAHVEAELLIIDEALSVGDARFTQKCMRYLREFQKKGTLLFVSHDTGALTNLCNRAIWLDQGELRMDGPARDIVEAYLAEQHAADRQSTGATVAIERSKPKTDIALETDVRAPMKDELGLRNVIKVFEFNEAATGAQFGAKGAKIERVELNGANGDALVLLDGSELVSVDIHVSLLQPLSGLIFGFYVKDRLGQRLFGDNTFLSYSNRIVSGKAGDRFRATFCFRMPALPLGVYTIDAAVATGNSDDHTQQHWIYDALEFRAVESTTCHGLIGIPMAEIKIESEEAYHA
jgi:lipopolysaccharide transport system ATP-binding protein